MQKEKKKILSFSKALPSPRLDKNSDWQIEVPSKTQQKLDLIRKMQIEIKEMCFGRHQQQQQQQKQRRRRRQQKLN
jgi:hypothetical protein